MAATDDIPRIVKHMALAIFRGPALRDPAGSVTKGNVAKFQSSLNIALAQLVKNGYLMSGAQSGKIEDMKLTPKGIAREHHHKKEGFRGPAKNAVFDVLWVALHPAPKPEETKKTGVKAKQHEGIPVIKKGNTAATTQQHAAKPDAAKAKTAIPKAKEQF